MPLLLVRSAFIVTLIGSSHCCRAGDDAKSNERVSVSWNEDQPHLLKITAGTDEPLSQILVVAWAEKENKSFLDRVKTARIEKGLVDSLRFFTGWAQKEAKDGSVTVLNGNYGNFSVAGVASRKNFGESRAIAQILDSKTKQSIGTLLCYTSSEMEFGNKINEVVIDTTNLELPDLAQVLWRNAAYIVVGMVANDGKIERNWEIKKADTTASEKKKSTTKKAKKSTEPRAEESPRRLLRTGRTWKDNTGNYSVEARFVSADAETVTLEKNESHQTIGVPRARLSKTDLLFLEAMEELAIDNGREGKTAPVANPAPPAVEVDREAAREHEPKKDKEKTTLPPMPDAAAARAPIDSPTATDILAAMDRNGFMPEDTVAYVRSFISGDESIAMYTFRNKKEREMSLRLTRNMVEFFGVGLPGPKYKLNASPGAKNRRALLTVLEDLSPKLRAKCDECLAEFARKRGRAIDCKFEKVHISVNADGVTLKSADW